MRREISFLVASLAALTNATQVLNETLDLEKILAMQAQETAQVNTDETLTLEDVQESKKVKASTCPTVDGFSVPDALPGFDTTT